MPNFHLGRLPVRRWSAPYYVGAAVIVPAAQSMSFQQRMQGAPGPANEAPALGVLIGTRGLADHKDAAEAAEFREIRLDDLRARGAERVTFLAG